MCWSSILWLGIFMPPTTHGRTAASASAGRRQRLVTDGNQDITSSPAVSWPGTPCRRAKPWFLFSFFFLFPFSFFSVFVLQRQAGGGVCLLAPLSSGLPSLAVCDVYVAERPDCRLPRSSASALSTRRLDSFSIAPVRRRDRRRARCKASQQSPGSCLSLAQMQPQRSERVTDCLSRLWCGAVC